MLLLNKKYPPIVLVGLFIVLGIFIIVFLYYKNTPVNNDNLNSLLFKKIRKISVKSVVRKKSIDYSNHGATYVVFGTDSLPIHSEWNEKIQIGDSIIKPKGSLQVIIKNNKMIDTLNYQNDQEEILTTNF